MWEADLNVSIQDGIWKQALNDIHLCSLNAGLQLIQFEATRRLRYSKVKLRKIFPHCVKDARSQTSIQVFLLVWLFSFQMGFSCCQSKPAS